MSNSRADENEKARLRIECETGPQLRAAEGIRTLDPELGKVVGFSVSTEVAGLGASRTVQNEHYEQGERGEMHQNCISASG